MKKHTSRQTVCPSHNLATTWPQPACTQFAHSSHVPATFRPALACGAPGPQITPQIDPRRVPHLGCAANTQKVTVLTCAPRCPQPFPRQSHTFTWQHTWPTVNESHLYTVLNGELIYIYVYVYIYIYIFNLMLILI